jgi:ADP-ribosyl-[dinitrogen reductase] hydrolase
MAEISRKDRAVGAIMGTLIGDALGLGCHWYYDLDAMRADYGDWISDYTDQKPDRTDRFSYIAKHRHSFGLKAGDVSQTGEMIVLLMESVANSGGYDEDDYTARLDGFLATLDGTDLSGRFSDRAVRHIWKLRNLDIPWGETGIAAAPQAADSHTMLSQPRLKPHPNASESEITVQAGGVTDTSEAAQRAVVIAALCGDDYETMAKQAYSNILLTHHDRYNVGYSLSFMLSVASLINGVPLNNIQPHLTTFTNNPAIEPMLACWDIHQQIGDGSTGADSSIVLDPRDACRIFGLACTMGFLAPAAYFLIHRFPDNFEMAVLNAVNGGGNQMARAALTGGLSGAMVGIQGIPERFITGLNDHERLLGLAEKIADGRPQISRKAS